MADLHHRNGKPILSLAERFWPKVSRLGPTVRAELGPCWTWRASRQAFGYGWFKVGDRPQLAHRVAWFLAHGRWPEPCALHKCDNPSCVRPDHLFEGDRAANTHDMIAKGRDRHPQGEAHTSAKLTPVQVLAIRAARAAGVSRQELARDYGVTSVLVRYIELRRIWRHI